MFIERTGGKIMVIKPSKLLQQSYTGIYWYNEMLNQAQAVLCICRRKHKNYLRVLLWIFQYCSMSGQIKSNPFPWNSLTSPEYRTNSHSNVRNMTANKNYSCPTKVNDKSGINFNGSRNGPLYL